MDKLKKLAVAGFLVGLLGFGGAAIAGAQTDSTDSSTSTTVVDGDAATTAPSDAHAPRSGQSDEECPNAAKRGSNDATANSSEASQSSVETSQL